MARASDVGKCDLKTEPVMLFASVLMSLALPQDGKDESCLSSTTISLCNLLSGSIIVGIWMSCSSMLRFRTSRQCSGVMFLNMICSGKRLARPGFIEIRLLISLS